MRLFKKGGMHRPLANLIHKGMVLIGTMIITSSVLANPVFNNVAAGNATIHQTPNSTVVNQASQKAIINWRSFNIGKTESTHFQQPAGGIALNRISPTQGASSIYGHLTATGKIILVNPAGFFFGPSAFVNVGGLIASTADISDQNFLNGVYKFDGISPFSGSIVNQGQIIAAANGLIALLGNGVQNDGLIQAQLGQVVLASGKAFTMNFAGNDLIGFSIDDKAAQGITNTGILRADGGTILVTARTTQGVLDNVINMEGIVQARSLDMQNGEIIFSGDPDTGVVRVAANVDVSGKGIGQTGGNIKVTGHNILIDNPAVLDASGDVGGGNIYVGGNYQGKGPLPNANAVVAMAGSKLIADAITNGNGGEVILWADDVTRAYGTISARGGAQGGDGGFIETSGKEYLDVAGIRVDTRAPHGTIGSWLLDPSDLTISTDPTSDVTPSGTPTNLFTADNNVTVSTLNVTDLTNALGLTDVTVLTTGGGAGVGAGNIAVFAPITWVSGTTLTLSAFNSVQLLANIDGGGFIALSNNSGGATDPNIYLLATAVTTTGNQVYNGPVLLVASNVLTAGGDVTFQGTVNSNDSAFHNLTINAAGDTTFNGVVGGAGPNFALGSLTTDAPGNTIINTTGITTLNGQTYNDVVSIQTDTILTSTAAGNIIFNTVDSQNLAFNDLTINTAGITRFNGIVGTTNNTALGTLTTDAPGSTEINTSTIRTFDNQVHNDAVTLLADLQLLNLSGGGAITFNNTVDGAHSLTLGSALNTVTTVFGDSVGAIDPLTSITAFDGVTTFNGSSVNTTGAQTYASSVTLGGANIQFNGVGIAFNNSLTSLATTNATITDSGTTTFGGVVLGLGNLTTNGGGTTAINGILVTTNGTQTYNDNVTLGVTTILTSVLNDVIFGGNVNGGNGLTISSAGTTTFGGTVGAGIALDSLTVAASGININGGAVTTLGDQSYTGALTLGADAIFTITGAGTRSIAINNGVGGNQNLTLIGGAASNDTFVIAGAMDANNVTVNGGGGTNSLTLNIGSQQWNITGGDSGNITGNAGVAGAFNYSNIANLTGGAGNDSYVINGGTLSGNINGGGGTNSLTADNVSNTWNLAGTNAGSVTGIGGAFSNIQNLIGGTTDDNFVLANGAVITGIIDGGSLAGTNTLNFANYIAPVNVTLASTNAGNAGGIAAYDNITTLIGDYTNDNIIATGKPFAITFTASREGFINDPIFFFGFTVNGSPSPTPPPPPPPDGGIDISRIIQQPTTNANDGANSPKFGTPLWLVLSDDTNSNLVDLLNQFTEEYNETLNKVTINPTCFATN